VPDIDIYERMASQLYAVSNALKRLQTSLCNDVVLASVVPVSIDRDLSALIQTQNEIAGALLSPDPEAYCREARCPSVRILAYPRVFVIRPELTTD
jgi:hypothetical protein